MVTRRMLPACLAIVILGMVPLHAQTPTIQPQGTVRINLLIGPQSIKFTSDDALDWRLEITDQQGQLVFDSAFLTATALVWPLVDAQGQPAASGVYRYAITIRGSQGPRSHRGELTVERASTLFQVAAMGEQTGDGTSLTIVTSETIAGATAQASGSIPTYLGTVTFAAPQPYISGSGTSGRMTRWSDGPNGIVADSQVSEANGAVVIGNGSFPGNLHIFGPSNNDLFAGMGPDVASGPAFNFGYGGASFGRSAGFFNVRPDASATPPNPSLRFMTSNAQRMIITNTGNVGIGVPNPAGKLDVFSNAANGTAIYGLSTAGQGVFGEGGFFAGVQGFSSSWYGVYGSSSSNIGVYGFSSDVKGVYGLSSTGHGLSGSSSNGVGAYGYSSQGVGVVGQTTSGIAGQFLGGNVGIGTETPARTLDVAGLFRVKNGAVGIEMNGAGELFPVADAIQPLGDGTHRWMAVFATLGTIQTSDARLKQRVTSLENGLAAVTRLRPVSFEWKDTGDGRRHLGLLAQEVEPVLPAVVHRDANPDVPLGLNYSELIPVVIKAIQEQQATITRLADENATLTARLAALEHVIQQIKKPQ